MTVFLRWDASLILDIIWSRLQLNQGSGESYNGSTKWSNNTNKCNHSNKCYNSNHCYDAYNCHNTNNRYDKEQRCNIFRSGDWWHSRWGKCDSTWEGWQERCKEGEGEGGEQWIRCSNHNIPSRYSVYIYRLKINLKAIDNCIFGISTTRKIPFVYSFSGNCTASVIIPTFMCLWAIYIFSGSVHIFPFVLWNSIFKIHFQILCIACIRLY